MPFAINNSWALDPSPDSRESSTGWSSCNRSLARLLNPIAVLSLALTLLWSPLYADDDPPPPSASDPAAKASAQRSYLDAQARFRKNPRNPEAAWQFGRAVFDRAEFSASKAERAELADEGIAACRQAVEREPKSAAAHYYLGMNLGQLARTKSLGALKLVGEMRREFEAVRELDAHLDYAGADRNLGLLYRDAPAIASIGNRSEAQRHLTRAVELAPEYPENRFELIEAYLKWGERAAALRELKALEEVWPKARTKLTGPAWASSWLDWDDHLKRLRKKIEEPRKSLEAPSHR